LYVCGLRSACVVESINRK